jgi:predicted nucleic acid-binding protein
MLYYLDTNIVIYVVEGQPPFRQRARNHIAVLENAGHRFVIGELTWTECLVLPLRTSDGPLLLDYERFFLGPNLTTVPMKSAAYHRAAVIRGRTGSRWRLLSSLYFQARRLSPRRRGAIYRRGKERFLAS